MTDTLLGLFIGVGLAAACGFRVFVPLFAASLAIDAGYLTPMAGFEWLGSPLAMVALGAATIVEVAGFYIPWVDNALDSLASPAAVIAGTVLTVTFLPDLGGFAEWVIAAIVGGGTAGVVQAGSVLVRGTSTATSGGLANPIVSTAELGGAVTMASMAIFIPLLAMLIVGLGLFYLIRKIWRNFARKEVTFVEPPAQA